MSAKQNNVVSVTGIVEQLIPDVNAGLDWEYIRERFDPDPEGKAITLHFLGEDGETLAEKVTLAIGEGPRFLIIEEDNPHFEKTGDVVTYQDYGFRVLDPDDPMTPEAARYQYNGVNIDAQPGESRERVWLIAASLLNIMLENVARENDGGN